MYDIAIVISTILSFLSYEAFNFYSGGIITAGYFSVFLTQPARILCTLFFAILICFAAKLVEKFTIFFGRRRFYFMIIFSAILSWIINKYLVPSLGFAYDIRIIGHIIPGLIANDMYKQGIIKTVLILTVLSILTYLISLALV